MKKTIFRLPVNSKTIKSVEALKRDFDVQIRQITDACGDDVFEIKCDSKEREALQTLVGYNK